MRLITRVYGSLLSQHSSSFEACGGKRFHLQEICARERFCILLRMKKCMALFHIKIFSCHVALLLKRKLQHVGHIYIVQWVKWVNSVRLTFNPGVQYHYYVLNHSNSTIDAHTHCWVYCMYGLSCLHLGRHLETCIGWQNRKVLSWNSYHPFYTDPQVSKFSSSFNFSGGRLSILSVKEFEDLPVS